MRCLIAVASALLSVACSAAPTASATVSHAVSTEEIRLREDALAAARVWLPPAVPIGEADLASTPGHTLFSPDADVQCRFTLDEVGGTTPKFYCQLPNGERAKVKYGAGNPELAAEVAASRLLTALGFPADRMYTVRSVVCAGCPRLPFQALRCYQNTGSRWACFPGGLEDTSSVRFGVAVVERRIEGRVIESSPDQGWAWYELDRIDPARGGSPRVDVDAFRLMARLLAHWDNKSTNQRLICPPSEERPDGSCSRPIAIMQDLGATFGPLKIDLENWRRDRIWKDASTCTVSMEHLPWGGGTFPETRISEDGRQKLVELLEQLSVAQLRSLFDGARVTRFDQVSATARSADAWISAFLDKVEQVKAAGPCSG